MRLASTAGDSNEPMTPAQYEEQLEALQVEKTAVEGQLEATQQMMMASLAEQHELRLAKVKEAEAQTKATEVKLEAALASVDEYASAMANALVKQHEAKLQAVQEAEKPLKASLKAERATTAELKDTVRSMAAKQRQLIVEAADHRAAVVQEFNNQIETLGKQVAQRDAQLAEYRAAMQDYMTKSHETKLVELQRARDEVSGQVGEAGASKQSLEKKLTQMERVREANEKTLKANEEQLSGLIKELEDIKALRDNYIKEREMELAALGDA